MRKVLLATFFIGLISLSMGSCKKKFTCKCWTSGADTIQKEGKGKSANDACEELEMSLADEQCIAA